MSEPLEPGTTFWRIDSTPTKALVEVEIGETLGHLGTPSAQRYRLRWLAESKWYDRSGSWVGLREWYDKRVDPSDLVPCWTPAGNS